MDAKVLRQSELDLRSMDMRAALLKEKDPNGAKREELAIKAPEVEPPPETMKSESSKLLPPAMWQVAERAQEKIPKSDEPGREDNSISLWIRMKQWITWPWRALKERREAARERQVAATRAQNARMLALQKGIREAELNMRRLTEVLVSKGESVVNAPIVLKKGEQALYTSDVEVLQQKTQKKTFRGYAGTRVKFGKIPVYVGGSAPHTVSQEVIVTVGTGNFTITNKRVVLAGTKINYSIMIDKINGIEQSSDGVQIFDEGSRGGRFYKVDDPMRAAIMLEVLLQKREEVPVRGSRQAP